MAEVAEVAEVVEQPEAAPGAWADARAEVQAAVAAVVHSAPAEPARPEPQYSPVRPRAKARPAQDRLPRPAPVPDSPFTQAAPVPMVMPPGASPMAMMWPTPGLAVPMAAGGSYGVQAVPFMGQMVGQPMAPPMAPAMAPSVAQPMLQPMLQPVVSPMMHPAQPIPQSVGQPAAYGGLGFPSAQAQWPASVPVAPVYNPSPAYVPSPTPHSSPAYSSSPAPHSSPAYRAPTRASTARVASPAVPHSWVAEASLVVAASIMVAAAVVIWVRIRGRVEACIGGCPDLDAVVSTTQLHAWAIICISAVAVVAAGFSLRRTRGTDFVRAVGALALIGALVTMVLGVMLLTTSLP
ncbi:MAG: hypothetical protein LBS56_07360 [Propionibacteriaceae bacterium]|jgi:hypothetical protein|nr:hypothetical protein [Propionibacteriaceae bacterium]